MYLRFLLYIFEENQPSLYIIGVVVSVSESVGVRVSFRFAIRFLYKLSQEFMLNILLLWSQNRKIYLNQITKSFYTTRTHISILIRINIRISIFTFEQILLQILCKYIPPISNIRTPNPYTRTYIPIIKINPYRHIPKKFLQLLLLQIFKFYLIDKLFI